LHAHQALVQAIDQTANTRIYKRIYSPYIQTSTTQTITHKPKKLRDRAFLLYVFLELEVEKPLRRSLHYRMQKSHHTLPPNMAQVVVPRKPFQLTTTKKEKQFRYPALFVAVSMLNSAMSLTVILQMLTCIVSIPFQVSI